MMYKTLHGETFEYPSSKFISLWGYCTTYDLETLSAEQRTYSYIPWSYITRVSLAGGWWVSAVGLLRLTAKVLAFFRLTVNFFPLRWRERLKMKISFVLKRVKPLYCFIYKTAVRFNKKIRVFAWNLTWNSLLRLWIFLYRAYYYIIPFLILLYRNVFYINRITCLNYCSYCVKRGTTNPCKQPMSYIRTFLKIQLINFISSLCRNNRDLDVLSQRHPNSCKYDNRV